MASDRETFIEMIERVAMHYVTTPDGLDMQTNDKTNIYVVSFNFDAKGEFKGIDLKVTPIDGPSKG